MKPASVVVNAEPVPPVRPKTPPPTPERSKSVDLSQRPAVEGQAPRQHGKLNRVVSFFAFLILLSICTYHFMYWHSPEQCNKMMEQLKGEHAREIAQLEEKHERVVAQLKEEHAREIEQLKKRERHTLEEEFYRKLSSLQA